MKVFLFMDFFFLERFQKFSHWSQKTFGLTNFWWAKFLAKIVFILSMLDYIIDVVGGMSGLALFLDSALQVYWLVVFVRVAKLCSNLDNKYENGYKYINERIIEWIGKRISYFIFLFPWSVLGIVISVITMDISIMMIILPSSIAIGLIIPCAYFLSCTPLPPGDSKAKLWLKGAKKKLKEAFSPNLEPVPTPC